MSGAPLMTSDEKNGPDLGGLVRMTSNGTDDGADTIRFCMDADTPVTTRSAMKVTFSEASLEADAPYKETIEDTDVDVDGKPREGWDNKVQFLLSVIGYAVGLGNVWRFPYLCQQYGGGAFLIPYVIMLFLEGMPVFLLEMGIGQRLRNGPIGVWNSIHPYLGGVGISSAVVSFFVALYYNVIITWCLFYLFHSFSATLPWGTCPVDANGTVVRECEMSSETVYFWYRTTLDTSPSINHFGGLNWKLVICLFAAWLIVYLCVMKGIKTSGKVMYVTSTFPYFVTTIFLIRSVMLPGAMQGIAYMFTPDLEKLIDPRTWLNAATQIFYSMGLAFGGLIAFSSYNPPKNDVRRDVFVLSATNLVTSLYTAFVIFCILGYKGHLNYEKCVEREITALQQSFPDIFNNGSRLSIEEYKHHEEVNFTHTDFSSYAGKQGECDFQKILAGAAEGTGLAFIVFTQAMVEFPGAPFWAVMFFLMLLSLGLGSMFGTLEGVITSIHDLKLFPWLKKPILTGILCAFSFLVGLIFVSRAGEYWVKLFDAFAGSYALMAVAFFEVIAVVYVYGWERFCDDILHMTGTRPGRYWQWTWRFICPAIMGGLFISSTVVSILEPATYHAYNLEDAKPEEADYPPWCMIVAGMLVFFAMCPVPFVFFVRYFKIWKFETDVVTASRFGKRQNSAASTGRLLSVNSMNSQTSMNQSTSIDSGNGIGLTYRPIKDTTPGLLIASKDEG